ncbi:zinc finger protein 25-like [Maniola jurtina]|uniref:zinc finger protein 25-like n=1 Tax=Maniola jurtina TaxID=191418 RepID=UPI001E68B833|nr:zinc finger protein 25-like [Maniola jurtina]
METRNSTIYGQCRFCLLNGHHKDLMKEYFVNGTREVYIDIIMECFNLYLSTNNGLSTLICWSCVGRLREAHSFRALVARSEQQLLATLTEKDTVFINVGDISSLEVKSEQPVVKQEPTEDSADNYTFYDEPVEIDPEHTDEEIEDLIDREAALLARFAHSKYRLPTRQSLYSTGCQGYAAHLDILRSKLIVPKTIEALLQEEQEKTSVKIYITEKVAHIKNSSIILEHSNATPFKSKNKSGFPCFYCRNIFENLEKLKEHQKKTHKKSEIKKILATFGAESLIVYVDITDLECTICSLPIQSINELKSHLTKVHNKKFHTEYPDRVIPFKLSNNNVFECQVCGFNFETFGSIERHMNVHYRNCVCRQCGTGFVTKYRLKVHIKSMHVGGNFPCDICKKVYTTQQKHKNHVDTVHKMVKRFKCPKCPERFTEYFRRQKHLVEIHGVAPLRYKCNVCDKAFERRYTLSRHMKRDHLEERDFQCQLCAYKCFTNVELRVHMVKHNGERIFECSVCKKSYARKKTLKEHMRIHNNDRRFACAVCGQAFVQKCSLKGHVKTHHAEYALFNSV